MHMLPPETSRDWRRIPTKQSSQDAPLPKPMSDSVKVDFLAHANIKVPSQERKAYEELIAQHHDVFSTDKNDLGCANHFEHKIQ